MTGHRAGPAGGGAEGVVLTAGVAAAALGVWLWAAGQLAGWINSGSWPKVPVSSTGSILEGLTGHWTDPRQAWPATARPGLPGPWLMYGCALTFVLPPLLMAAAWRRRRTDPRAGGQPVAGARWASGGDLRALRIRGPKAGRLVVGRRAGTAITGRLVATEARHSVLVIGPTQSGKTTGLAIPALLEWHGPVIATSVKDDLAATTHGWRSRQGPCWIFDPTATSGLHPLARWTPLAASRDWSGAQRTAGWLVEATPARAGLADAAFWYA
ncbi:MAG TPA: type IV secretory system conjugative DNA transfer family protein, partial [Acidimicrobiales bacterium]|nr:type IV secretory system conjugative DNA transfer family protein [Acidimicrobiales bacterium]